MPFTETQHQEQALDSLKSQFPRLYKVDQTKFLKGLLAAISTGDGYVASQVEAVRDNLISTTASGRFLDRAAGRYGIVRGQGAGILDPDFRNIIPILGLSYKQISHTLAKIVDTIYGPFASHANVTSGSSEPFALIVGSDLTIRVDDQTFRIIFTTEDALSLGAATAAELAAAISKKTNGRLIGTSSLEARTGKKFLNLRTSTIGTQGFVQVIGGDAQSKLMFPDVRPVSGGSATWDISRYLGTDEMTYSVTAGPVPNFGAAGVMRKDLCTIRTDSGFDPKNVGTFEVTQIGTTSFRVRNGRGTPESGIAQAHTDDLTFYLPRLANVLLTERPAALIETASRELTVVLPVTSPIVKRTIRGGHHFHQGLSSVLSTSSSTIVVASITGFVSPGAVRPILSRLSPKAVVSSVGASTVTLIDAANWPNKGAIIASNISDFLYYSGRSGNTLTGVSPSPPAALAGAEAKYSERYRFTGISGSTLTGVFPDPTGIAKQEIFAAGVITGTNFPGSFLYDPKAKFTPASSGTTISETIRQGDVKTILAVSDVSSFPSQGFFVLEFGDAGQEGPIRYFAKVGTKSLIVDPSHTYAKDHLSNSRIRLVRQIGPYLPRLNGQDLAVYNTSTAPARDLLAQYLRLVSASGVNISFSIRVPDQKWPVLQNLYTTDPLATEIIP